MADTTAPKSGGGFMDIASGVTGIATQVLGFLGMSKAQKKQLELQEKEMQFQQALGQLNSQQNYVLQSQLNSANTDTERYNILTNAVTQIKLNNQTTQNSSSNQTTYLIIGVLLLSIIALVVIKKN
jgi:hypothetical protein